MVEEGTTPTQSRGPGSGLLTEGKVTTLSLSEVSELIEFWDLGSQ